MSKTTRKIRSSKKRLQGISLEQVLKAISTGKTMPIAPDRLAIVDIPGIVSIALVRLGRDYDLHRVGRYHIEEIIAIGPKARINNNSNETIYKYLRRHAKDFYCVPLSQYAVIDPKLCNKIRSTWDALHLHINDPPKYGNWTP